MTYSDYPAALKKDSILDGRYIVQDVLGQGGFGITYKALDFRTSQEVAIKEYFPTEYVVRETSHRVLSRNQETLDQYNKGKSMFLREADALYQFNGSPNVVHVYRYFEERGTNTAYYVMDYVRGVTLAQYLKDRGGRLTWEEVWELLLPLTNTLPMIHERGIIHRDIKPQNILITDDHVPILIDFGAARHTYGVQSKSLGVILTPGFAPLEQYTSGGNQGPWTDVYAFAATLYTCITGRAPVASVDRTLQDSLQTPEELGITIPYYAESTLIKALAVHAEDRFQSMNEFIHAVLTGKQLEEERLRRQAGEGKPQSTPSSDHPGPGPQSLIPLTSGKTESTLNQPGQNRVYIQTGSGKAQLLRRLKIPAAVTAAVLVLVLIASQLVPKIRTVISPSRERHEEIVIETRPYDAPDPEVKASAYPWICSDIVDNVTKLDGLSETDDFHAAVNREWLSSNTIPSGFFKYDVYDERQEQVNRDLLSILESNVVYSDDAYISHCQELTQNFYTMWLDWDSRNARGVEPLREITEPLVSVKTLDELSAYLRQPDVIHSADVLCSLGVLPNLNDTAFYSVYIQPDNFVLGDDAEYYRNAADDDWKNQSWYTGNAAYMLERLGCTQEERDRILQDCFSFEKELAKSVMTSEEGGSEDFYRRINNQRTFKEIKEAQGKFPLTDMLESLNLHKSDSFILTEPEWLSGLKALYNEENLDRIKAYLLVSDVLYYMQLLDRDCYEQYNQVQISLGNITGTIEDKYAACEAVNEYLGTELGCVYAEAYITSKNRADIRALTDEIIESSREILSSADFMSEETRARAVSKLDNMQINVARPDDLKSLAGKNEISFSGPEEGGTVFDARIAISRAYDLGNASKVNQSVDRTEWSITPQDVSVNYSPFVNALTIPAGVLGDPFYSDQLSREQKLGGIGTIIAQMIFYAFTPTLRQFDEYGNLCNWWSQEDYDQYHARAQKAVDYFSGFSPFEGTSVNGDLVADAVIADLAGLKCVLNIGEKDGQFDYDSFFRMYAASKRTLTTQRIEQYWAEQGSLLRYLETNAVLVQFERFHKTYGTKSGDGMYLDPEYRLEIW